MIRLLVERGGDQVAQGIGHEGQADQDRGRDHQPPIEGVGAPEQAEQHGIGSKDRHRPERELVIPPGPAEQGEARPAARRARPARGSSAVDSDMVFTKKPKPSMPAQPGEAGSIGRTTRLTAWAWKPTTTARAQNRDAPADRLATAALGQGDDQHDPDIERRGLADQHGDQAERDCLDPAVLAAQRERQGDEQPCPYLVEARQLGLDERHHAAAEQHHRNRQRRRAGEGGAEPDEPGEHHRRDQHIEQDDGPDRRHCGLHRGERRQAEGDEGPQRIIAGAQRLRRHRIIVAAAAHPGDDRLVQHDIGLVVGALGGIMADRRRARADQSGQAGDEQDGEQREQDLRGRPLQRGEAGGGGQPERGLRAERENSFARHL